MSAETVVSAETPVVPATRDYALTLRFSFSGFDDADARRLAKNLLLVASYKLPEDQVRQEIKLQRIRKDGPPEKVEI